MEFDRLRIIERESRMIWLAEFQWARIYKIVRLLDEPSRF